jgi:hypothetical protein
LYNFDDLAFGRGGCDFRVTGSKTVSAHYEQPNTRAYTAISIIGNCMYAHAAVPCEVALALHMKTVSRPDKLSS